MILGSVTRGQTESGAKGIKGSLEKPWSEAHSCWGRLVFLVGFRFVYIFSIILHVSLNFFLLLLCCVLLAVVNIWELVVV